MRALPILLLLAGSAVAAPKKKVPPPKPPAGQAQSAAELVASENNKPAPNTTHAEGDYGGVEPGHGAKDKPKKPPPKGTLAWVGFEAKGGGSQLFLQSIAPFEVSQHVDKGVLIVDLNGLTRLGANTWRDLDTRFFDTPIAHITAKGGGKKGIEVKVTFKNPKDAKEAAMRTATEGDGYFYAYLTFGAGSSTVNMAEPDAK